MQQPMYDAKVNSPKTELATAIDATQTTFDVTDATVLPTTPNLLTVGEGVEAETMRYTDVTGNTLTVERGFQGDAQSWAVGSSVARLFTAYDLDSLQGNVTDVDGRFVAHKDEKATLTDSAHVQTGVVSVVIPAIADSGTASSATSTTLTDTTKTWVVDGFINQKVTITGGTGSGQSRNITSNTADTLTVGTAWDTIPDGTTTYEISVWVGAESPYSQVITATGVNADEVATVDINLDSAVDFEAEKAVLDAWAFVYRVKATAVDEVTIWATDEPVTDIPVNIKVVR